MSSIYDALQRIQEEKGAWSSPVIRERPPAKRKTVWLIISAIIISSLCTTGVFYGIKAFGERKTGVRTASPLGASSGIKEAGLTEQSPPADQGSRPSVVPVRTLSLPVSPASETVDGYLKLGEQYFTVKDYDKALLTYTKALHYFRKDARLLNNIGSVFLAKGQADKAIHYFKESSSISNASVEPVYNLACAYAVMGNKAKAISYLKQACTKTHEAKTWAASDPDLADLRGTREFDRIIGAH